MYPPLRIKKELISYSEDRYPVFDMMGRCAFAICTKGKLVVKILHEEYPLEKGYIIACMPFVNVDVISVGEDSELVFGFVLIEDIPPLINRWINTDNLFAIQNHPMVIVPKRYYSKMVTLLNEYQEECKENEMNPVGDLYSHIQRDIVDCHSRLIVAYVLRIYFSSISMEVSGHTHHDMVFQQFMLSLYSNFREHRNVKFYAVRSGMSLKYFSTLIRKLSGNTPSEWIERVVVGEAKSMLSEFNRSIKGVGTALNFPDTPTFTKYFHRATGMTPKAYRKTIL